MNNTLIAVYGTLRKGYGNSVYLRDSKFIGAGWTKDKYKMTANGIPFVKKSEPVSKIRVEIYEVAPENLPHIDSLEGHPNWYYREPISIDLDNGDNIEASIYFNNQEGNYLIESGDYKTYR